MNKYEVKAGYYEWNVYKNGKVVYTIDDGSGQIAEDVTDRETGDLISAEKLRELCGRYADAICSEDKSGTLDSISALSSALFTALARHFCYDEDEISEWDGSAVTNIAIVEDGNGKIHEFTKIIDERENWTFDAFQREVQSWADKLGGCILAIYRKRDIAQRCRL